MGVDPAQFTLLFKEREFGTNYRDADLFDQLIDTLGDCSPSAFTE